jgi:osmotically-inducible protein OsmY
MKFLKTVVKTIVKTVVRTVAIGVLVGACAAAARPASAAARTPATAASSTSASSTAASSTEDALEARVSQRIKKSASLAPRDIDVEVNGSVVTLTGSVKTTEEKARAGRLAKVEGVSKVDNQIEIDPKIDQSRIDAAGEKTKKGLSKAVDATVDAAKKTKEVVQKGVGKSEEGVAKAADKTSDALGKVGDKAGDAAVSTRVKADLSNDALLKDTAIEVETTDHVVTLKGTVPSAEAKARAVDVARETDGVTRVVDQVVVTAR